ncbi:MAG: GNAT family protein [Pseudomonadota bacterium]
MFQLQSVSPSIFDPELVCDPLKLRSPKLRDHREWVRVRNQSRAHLIRWEDDWTSEDVTIASFRRRLRLWERQRRQGAALSLFIFKGEDGPMIGGVTITNIRYGAARAGTLGYWIDQRMTRKGYGAKAVHETAAHAFSAMGLRRIEAACQTENQASAALLRKVGFQKEGRARDYLKINGVWRDHDIYSLLAADMR